MKQGANCSQDGCEFKVWAPRSSKVSLVLPDKKRVLPMDREEEGYWRVEIDKIEPRTRYLYRLNNHIDRADPASYSQPDGVFGNSAVLDHSSFVWKDDNWRGIELKNMVIYELHVGAFSPEGTFAAVRKKANSLAKIGITAVELMPISQFSGDQNWGYDAVFPNAVQNTYGGPDELKKLVQEFHHYGIAVILDVVYNHLGPEGNFFADFGPYFLSSRKTPWGPGINFDGPSNIHVRAFFLENAIHWFQDYHVDGLRLDAVYAIIDSSPKHFLRELSEKVQNLTSSRKMLLIAENNKLDPKLIESRNRSGFGLDALWHDNLHHSLHSILTGERNWYYASFGVMRNLVDALQASRADCWQKADTAERTVWSPDGVEPTKLVVFSQNHDQIGNRPRGERLITLAGLEAAKLAAAIVILSQYTPLFFMGEEYGENTPFVFFTDYSNRNLGEKVRIGRQEEFIKNGWKNVALNPQSPAAFVCSRISWRKRFNGTGKKVLSYYETLLRLRKTLRANHVAEEQLFTEGETVLVIQRYSQTMDAVIIANFGRQECQHELLFAGGDCLKVLDSADIAWAGPGSALPAEAKFGDKLMLSPTSAGVYVRRKGEKRG